MHECHDCTVACPASHTVRGKTSCAFPHTLVLEPCQIAATFSIHIHLSGYPSRTYYDQPIKHMHATCRHTLIHDKLSSCDKAHCRWLQFQGSPRTVGCKIHFGTTHRLPGRYADCRSPHCAGGRSNSSWVHPAMWVPMHMHNHTMHTYVHMYIHMCMYMCMLLLIRVPQIVLVVAATMANQSKGQPCSQGEVAAPGTGGQATDER